MPRSNGIDVGWSYLRHKRIRPTYPRVVTSSLTLDPIPSHELNLHAFRELEQARHGTDTIYLRTLLGETDLSQLLLSAPRRIRRLSRRMYATADYLVQQGIAQEDNAIHSALQIFLTPKKNGNGRLVINARDLNAYFKPPPRMELPSLHEVITYVMRAEVAASADAKSYFYQIPLPSILRPYFGFRVPRHSRGGGFRSFSFSRLPMGWSWAPSLAQHLANLLAGDDAMAWVDNFVVAGTRETFEKRRSAFLGRVDQGNVLLDDHALEPRTRLQVLGLDLDLELKRYCLAESTCPKVDLSSTRREVYLTAGKLLWGDYVRQTPLCTRAELLQIMSKIGIEAGSWDDVAQLTPEEVQHINQLVAKFVENEWTQWSETPDPERHFLAYSDASDDAGAYILFDEDRKVCGSNIFGLDRTDHIFLKELDAAVRAVESVPAQGGTNYVHLYMDNLPAVMALRNKASSVRAANELIMRIAHRRFGVEWVPTEQNLADSLTRGGRPPKASLDFSTWSRMHNEWREKKDHYWTNV